MRIELQVCTFPQAMALWEAGIDQQSAFAWVDGEQEPKHRGGYEWSDHPGYSTYSFLAAFNVAELGNMIPEEFRFERLFPCFVTTTKFEQKAFGAGDGSKWVGIIAHQGRGAHSTKPLKHFYGQTEAEVRAEILIMGIRDGFFAPNEINARIVAASRALPAISEPPKL